MSDETLRKAASLMRARAEAVPAQPRVEGDVTGVWLNSRYYLTTPPSVSLALADLLDVWAREDLATSPFTLPEELACIGDIARAYLGESA